LDAGLTILLCKKKCCKIQRSENRMVKFRKVWQDIKLLPIITCSAFNFKVLTSKAIKNTYKELSELATYRSASPTEEGQTAPSRSQQTPEMAHVVMHAFFAPPQNVHFYMLKFLFGGGD
jgi:hypothetical protein